MLLVAKNLAGNIFFLYLTYHVPPVLYLTDELQKYEWLLSLFFLSLFKKYFCSVSVFRIRGRWSSSFSLKKIPVLMYKRHKKLQTIGRYVYILIGSFWYQRYFIFQSQHFLNSALLIKNNSGRVKKKAGSRSVLGTYT